MREKGYQMDFDDLDLLAMPLEALLELLASINVDRLDTRQIKVLSGKLAEVANAAGDLPRNLADKLDPIRRAGANVGPAALQAALDVLPDLRSLALRRRITQVARSGGVVTRLLPGQRRRRKPPVE